MRQDIDRSPPSPVRRALRRLGGWIRPRSRGVPVPRAVHRAIARGNAARARGDWAAAAAGFRAALGAMPELGHIWIQLGHALKETADPTGADAAYARAQALAPDDVEPLLRRAHLANDGGDRIAAARHFVALLQRQPDQLEARAELLRLLPPRAREPALWHDALVCLGIDPALAAPPDVALPPGALVVDVGDLIAYFGRRRLPTGIQRVQIEVVLAWLAAGSDSGVLPCGYAGDERRWIAVPAELLGAVCRASLASDDRDDPAWARQVMTLQISAAAAPSIRFARGCVLANLGNFTADRGYLEAVDAERRASGLAYVAFVHDLIPLLRPGWFVPTLGRDFRPWLERLLAVADGYLANSESTRADLIAVAARLGRPVAPERARVTRIDGDMRGSAGTVPDERAEAAALAKRGLAARGFVLMVSTIEPRKNHLGAFGAWLRLAETLGEARLPPLVCVGGGGWLNEPMHAMRAAHPLLGRKTVLLAGIADDELALLYRACRFTLYPSFYEGWGLPVSESLSHGRVPAIARTSSLPEAGGAFAVYFDPADPADIAARITPLIRDDAALAAAEARIRAGYRARSWAAIARQIADEARAIAAEARAARLAADRFTPHQPGS